MAKPRKKWSELSDKTKANYKKHGISPNTYNAGKISEPQKRLINGRSSFEIERARERGLLQQFPNIKAFEKIPIASKRRLASAYLAGITKKNSPLERGMPYGLTPIDAQDIIGYDDFLQPIPNPHYGHQIRSRDAWEARKQFDRYMEEIEEDFDFDWDVFRDLYKTGF